LLKKRRRRNIAAMRHLILLLGFAINFFTQADPFSAESLHYPDWRRKPKKKAKRNGP